MSLGQGVARDATQPGLALPWLRPSMKVEHKTNPQRNPWRPPSVCDNRAGKLAFTARRGRPSPTCLTVCYTWSSLIRAREPLKE
jgi:hypothetical protein